MISLQLSNHRKARIWLANLPDARVSTTKILDRSVQGGPLTFEGTRRAVIEILIPRGPRSLYGLLGAELHTANKSENLVIHVLTSHESGRPFTSSIALASEETQVGLPAAYSEAVFEGAIGQIKGIGGMCSGELVFDYAVHGQVGSAPIVFKWLAARLVQVLEVGEDINQQQLTEILQTVL